VRTKLPKDIETQVLVLCRRRCCICFGLNRDTSLKEGQVAQLDHDSSNSELDNLAFLCFVHHNQYDSRTNQGKNLTPAEVRRYRVELHNVIEQVWKEPVRIGEVEVQARATVAGRYVRVGDFDSAELKVEDLGEGRVRITGLALWGKGREYGPHIGELLFETTLLNNGANFVQKVGDATYSLQLQFFGDGLLAKERYVVGYFGMNVSFDGLYQRVGLI
jgi:hypothetical protein